MCGITGFYSLDPESSLEKNARIIKDMCDAIALRGPDDENQWLDNNAPVALGHRRLSIIDLSPAGAQPMQSDTERYVIVFNGEIYNFHEIKKSLDEQGFDAPYRGHSDTEILLRSIENLGVQETLSKINGMFAFALWDKKNRLLHFARDRMGKKPLYIGWAGNYLVFASELKAICAHPDFNKDINRSALASYMRFGYVPSPLSIYKNIWQLPAGCTISIDTQMLANGQDIAPLIEHFWSHKDALIDARKNPVEQGINVIDEFETLLCKCIEERMISDVPLGAFLSGGIDSSTIVALMQKISNVPVKTYSIGFNEKGYDEAAHAKAIAKHLGTEHHELYINPKDTLDIVPKLAQIYDEPFADASAIPTYLVSRFARESVTVALSGDGGDEMLGGYNRHISGPKAWKIAQNIPDNFRDVIGKIIRFVPPEMWEKLRPSHPQFGSHIHKFAYALEKDTPSDFYLALVSDFQSPKKFVLDSKEEMIPLVNPDMQINDANFSFAEEMMYWDALSYLNGDVLTKVDRASMAASLEARAPLLDTRIYDYVWRLPMEMKIRDGKGKWLLRQILEKHIPKELYDRPKQGFSVPIDSWLRGELKDWAEDLLDEYEIKAQGLLDNMQIQKMWNEHQKGTGNHSARLWNVLMFQSWYRQWISG